MFNFYMIDYNYTYSFMESFIQNSNRTIILIFILLSVYV